MDILDIFKIWKIGLIRFERSKCIEFNAKWMKLHQFVEISLIIALIRYHRLLWTIIRNFCLPLIIGVLLILLMPSLQRDFKWNDLSICFLRTRCRNLSSRRIYRTKDVTNVTIRLQMLVQILIFTIVKIE